MMTPVASCCACAPRCSYLATLSLQPWTPCQQPLILQGCMRAQAGTYIKEFVHGDGGRTLPSLGSLLGCGEPAEILELDVLEVHMDFLP